MVLTNDLLASYTLLLLLPNPNLAANPPCLLVLSPLFLSTSSTPVIRPWLLGARRQPHEPQQRYRHVHHVYKAWRPTTTTKTSTTLITTTDKSEYEQRSETIDEFEIKLILPFLFLVFTLWILTMLLVFWR